jgi:hypothetical protein
MITAQVFQDITVQQMASIAQACGFATQIDKDGDLWINIAGDATIVGFSADRKRVFFLTSLRRTVTPAHANGFYKRHTAWCSLQVSDDSRPVMIRWFFAQGTTRDHVAQEMFFWEHKVREFFSYFGGNQD